ncbi:hypothetical protein [Mycobacterium sp.]|uniref:hypothetical protein n=1 Tax=Mycobacterium sp. TaxID=1785 RepID=UPI003F9AA5A4
MIAATVFASPALAEAPLTPGSKIADETSWCTAAYATQGNDNSYYLMTSGHCDAHDERWTYGDDSAPLGTMSAQEYEENGETGTQKKDAAIIRLDPSVGVPNGDVGGKYPVRDVLSLAQLTTGVPFCEIGAVHWRDLWRNQRHRY